MIHAEVTIVAAQITRIVAIAMRRKGRKQNQPARHDASDEIQGEHDGFPSPDYGHYASGLRGLPFSLFCFNYF